MQSIRSLMYFLAKILGDVNAIQKGKVHQRLLRRLIGKLIGRALW